MSVSVAVDLVCYGHFILICFSYSFTFLQHQTSNGIGEQKSTDAPVPNGLTPKIKEKSSCPCWRLRPHDQTSQWKLFDCNNISICITSMMGIYIDHVIKRHNGNSLTSPMPALLSLRHVLSMACTEYWVIQVQLRQLIPVWTSCRILSFSTD